MKKYGRLLVAVLWFAVAGLLMAPAIAVAQPAPSPTTPTTTPQCVSAAQFANLNAGPEIVTTIFGDGTTANPGVINTIMNTVSGVFYNNVVGSPGFSQIVFALMVLYLTIYGAMIMFNMVHVSTGDIIGRLIKIGIIYAVVSPSMVGWAFFYNWVGGFFMGGMNELIAQFSQAGISGGTSPVVIQPGMTVNPSVMQALVGPIGQVFSAKFMVIIVSLGSTGLVGPVLMFLLIWALIDFIFMVIGAMGTYVKSVIGLAFLFGIAPVFFLFLLFDKTRQVFYGWLNQVVAFSLTPVMLFAFLAFYCQLISGTLTNMLAGTGTSTTDWCWAYWFSIPGLWDIWWWRPLVSGGVGGACIDSTTKLPCVPLPPIDILYFLLLCHLGKSFSNFIENLAQDMSGGTGPGVIKGGEIGNWFRNNLTRGLSPSGLGAIFGTAAVAAGFGANKLGLGRDTAIVSRRTPIAAGGVPGSAPLDKASGALNLAGVRTHLDTALAEGWLSAKGKAQAKDNILKGLSGGGLLEAYISAVTPEEVKKATGDIGGVVRTAIANTPLESSITKEQREQLVEAAVNGIISVDPKKT